MSDDDTLVIGDGEIEEVIPLDEDTGVTPIYVAKPQRTNWGAVALTAAAVGVGLWALRRWM